MRTRSRYSIFLFLWRTHSCVQRRTSVRRLKFLHFKQARGETILWRRHSCLQRRDSSRRRRVCARCAARQPRTQARVPAAAANFSSPSGVPKLRCKPRDSIGASAPSFWRQRRSRQGSSSTGRLAMRSHKCERCTQKCVRHTCSPVSSGQRETECRALAGCAFHPDTAALPLYHLLTDRQPYSGSGKLASVEPLEWFEDQAGILGVNSDPVVANRDEPFPRPTARRGNVNPRMFATTISYGVFEQILKELVALRRMTRYNR